jgi:hypothetical protein
VAAARRPAWPIFLFFLGASLGVPPVAAAQTCGGRAAFNMAPVQIEFGTRRSLDAHGILASGGYGTDALFGVASFARLAAATGNPAYDLTILVGTDQPLTPDNRFRACPIAGMRVTRSNGSGRAKLVAGANANLLVRNDPGLTVTTTLGLRFQSADSDDQLDPELTAFMDAPINVVTGVGFIFRNRISLEPAVSLAVRDGDLTTSLHVGLAYNFVRR